MVINTKKNKRTLRKLLGALDPSLKSELTAQQIKEDVSGNLSQFAKQISQALSTFKTELLAAVVIKLRELPDYSNQIKTLKGEFESKLAELETEEIPVIQTQMQELVSNDIQADETLRDDVEEKLKDLRREFFNRLSNLGGGSPNRQISVNSSVIGTKYTDINFIAGSIMSISTAVNDTTKQIDFTISGSDTGITQLTGDVTAGPGSGSQVATLTSVLVAGGPIGSSTVIPIITWDAKGRLTVVSSVVTGVVPSGQTYAITNVTTDRAYNADLTTVDELADTLGTLIADLKAAKIIL